MDEPAARLRRFAIGDAGPPDRAWLAEIADRMSAGMSWPAAILSATRAERDNLLRDLCRQHYAALRPRPAAEAIARDLGRYEATSWRRDRFAVTCPHPAGSHRAALWAVLGAGPPALQSRQIFEIIASIVQSDPIAIAQTPDDHSTVEHQSEGGDG